MRWRSLREIRFRLRQEIRNAFWLLRPPKIPELPVAPLPFPDGHIVAETLRETAFARDTIARAEAVLRGEIELFSRPFAIGEEIEWRKDYASGKSSGLAYFRTIPYLDFERAGDHKMIWELNRHQHLVTLAQAYLFSHDRRFLDEIPRQIESWMEQNPFLRGINWASALEAAFRSLSWIWIDHLAGADFPASFRQKLHRQLYLHGLYIRNNLSFYFSPNTHLTGEAAALHALGYRFHQAGWKKEAADVLDREINRQIREDGSYFEQSSYYHVYSLDIFLFHALFRNAEAGYSNRLAKMADFLDALLGPSRRIPFFGDDDGGRFFHPYGDRSAFGRASLAGAAQFLHHGAWEFSEEDTHEIAAWWLPRTTVSSGSNQGDRFFPNAGIAILHKGPWQLVMDAGSFGAPPSSHSHADTLSFVLHTREEEIFIDPGTYTYVADARQRNLFRGTAMHNTIRIDERDQADPVNPFRWENLPAVTVRRFSESEIEAECRYRGCVHTRKLIWNNPRQIIIADEVTGPPGQHIIEQFWHPGVAASLVEPRKIKLGEHAVISLPREASLEKGGQFGWRSEFYGSKRESFVITLRWETALPWRAETVLDLEA